MACTGSISVPAGNNSTHGSEQDLNRLGVWLGAAAQSDADRGPDFAPPESDLLTAEHLGERVSKGRSSRVVVLLQPKAWGQKSPTRHITASPAL